MYVCARSTHSFCIRVSHVVPKQGSSEHCPCAIAFTFIIPCVSSGLYVLVEFSLHVLSSGTCTDSRSPRFLQKKRPTKKRARPRAVISSSQCRNRTPEALGQPRLLCQQLSSSGRCYTRMLPCTRRVLNCTRSRLWCAEGHCRSRAFFIVICQRTQHVSFVVAEAWCMQNAIFVYVPCFVIT